MPAKKIDEKDTDRGGHVDYEDADRGEGFDIDEMDMRWCSICSEVKGNINTEISNGGSIDTEISNRGSNLCLKDCTHGGCA